MNFYFFFFSYYIKIVLLRYQSLPSKKHPSKTSSQWYIMPHRRSLFVSTLPIRFAIPLFPIVSPYKLYIWNSILISANYFLVFSFTPFYTHKKFISLSAHGFLVIYWEPMTHFRKVTSALHLFCTNLFYRTVCNITLYVWSTLQKLQTIVTSV